MRTRGSPQWLEAVRCLAVRLALEGHDVPGIADALGVHVASVYRRVACHRTSGEVGLVAVRHPGAAAKLTPRQAARAVSWVKHGSPPDFGFPAGPWTARRVAAVVERRIGVSFNHRYLNDWLGRRGISPQAPDRVPRERDEAAVARWRRHTWPLVKGARAAGATIVFTDESGLLMAPLLRTTLAERGRTPVLLQRASHRDKASVAAALWRTPGGLVRLAYRTYPNGYVNNERYADFLEDVLADRLARVPVTVVHDGGNMHRGEPVDGLDADIERLVGFVTLPPYAPELNPVEALWNWLKYDELANFAPLDVAELDRVVNRKLAALHRDQPRLRSFLANSPLRW